jgi:hypothetical protein
MGECECSKRSSGLQQYQFATFLPSDFGASNMQIKWFNSLIRKGWGGAGVRLWDDGHSKANREGALVLEVSSAGASQDVGTGKGKH